MMMAQENLKLAAFVFHHRQRCTLDWEITEVDEETVCLLAGQKKLEDECKDPDMLPKINKFDMAEMMESIEEYLRSHCGVVRESLAYIISKTIIVQTYGEYPMYATPVHEMIARMLHLPPDKNKLLSEKDVQRVQVQQQNTKLTTGWSMTSWITDLYPYVMQQKPKRDNRGAFYAIHSKWLGPNQVNTIASKAEMTLQTSTYNGEKRA